MHRIFGLAVAAALLAGCGQYGSPGAQAAKPAVVVETTYAQVAVAPPPVVIHEVSYESPPAVVNTNTNTTTVAAQPAVDQVVVVREGSRYRGYRSYRPHVVMPILHRLFGGPRRHPPPPQWRGGPDHGRRKQGPPDHGRTRPAPDPHRRRGGRG